MGGWGGGFGVLKRGLGPGVAVLGPPFNLKSPESVTLIPFPSPEAPKPLHQAWLPFWGRAKSAKGGAGEGGLGRGRKGCLPPCKQSSEGSSTLLRSTPSSA